MKLFRAPLAFLFLDAQCREATNVYAIVKSSSTLQPTEENSYQYARVSRLFGSAVDNMINSRNQDELHKDDEAIKSMFPDFVEWVVVKQHYLQWTSKDMESYGGIVVGNTSMRVNVMPGACACA